MIDTLFQVGSQAGQAAVVTTALLAVVCCVFVYMGSIVRELDKGQDSAGANGGGSQQHGGSEKTPSARDNHANNHSTGFTIVNYAVKPGYSSQPRSRSMGGGGGRERGSSNESMYKDRVNSRNSMMSKADQYKERENQLQSEFNELHKKYLIAKESGDVEKSIEIHRQMEENLRESERILEKIKVNMQDLKKASNH